MHITSIMVRRWRRVLSWIALHLWWLYHVFAFFLPVEKQSITIMAHKRRTDMFDAFAQKVRLDGTFSVRYLETGPGIGRYLHKMMTLARSRFILVDGHCKSLYGIRPRRGSAVIQTWHAAGIFKKFAGDLCPPNDMRKRARFLREHCSYSWILTSAPAVNEVYARAFGKSTAQTLALGSIKTDLLYHARDQAASLRARLEETNPMVKGKQIILYAPTFRKEELDGIRNASKDYLVPCIASQMLEKRFAGQYVLAFRPHYFVQDEYTPDPACLDAAHWPLHEALALADVLITDYSSIFFDFLFFRKPMVFFAYDLDRYTTDRGFYMDYESFVPGPVCRTEEEVLTALESFAGIDVCTRYKYAEIWGKYMGACDGNVSAKLLRFLKKQESDMAAP